MRSSIDLFVRSANEFACGLYGRMFGFVMFRLLQRLLMISPANDGSLSDMSTDGHPCLVMTHSKSAFAMEFADLSSITLISVNLVSWSMKTMRYLEPRDESGSCSMSVKTRSQGLRGMLYDCGCECVVLPLNSGHVLQFLI